MSVVQASEGESLSMCDNDQWLTNTNRINRISYKYAYRTSTHSGESSSVRFIQCLVDVISLTSNTAWTYQTADRVCDAPGPHTINLLVNYSSTAVGAREGQPTTREGNGGDVSG